MQFVLKTATSGLPSPSQCKSITFDSDDDDDNLLRCYNVTIMNDDENFYDDDDIICHLFLLILCQLPKLFHKDSFLI